MFDLVWLPKTTEHQSDNWVTNCLLFQFCWIRYSRPFSGLTLRTKLQLKIAFSNLALKLSIKFNYYSQKTSLINCTLTCKSNLQKTASSSYQASILMWFKHQFLLWTQRIFTWKLLNKKPRDGSRKRQITLETKHLNWYRSVSKPWPTYGL